MSSVLELKPGDRVVLYSPAKERRSLAVYEGTYPSLAEATRRDGPDVVNLICPACAEWLNGGVPFARFMLRKAGLFSFVAAYRVAPDGRMTSPEGEDVVIDERIAFTGRG